MCISMAGPCLAKTSKDIYSSFRRGYLRSFAWILGPVINQLCLHVTSCCNPTTHHFAASVSDTRSCTDDGGQDTYLYAWSLYGLVVAAYSFTCMHVPCVENPGACISSLIGL